jgi:hypothetical protein
MDLHVAGQAAVVTGAMIEDAARADGRLDLLVRL